MALVQRLTHKKLEKSGTPTEVECTYSIVGDDVAGRCLQIDTYGSTMRENPATVSQTIRLAPEAIQQLKALLQKHF